jgi:hypothetical protein
MPDAVFAYRMPAGIPGELTRFNVIGTTVEAQNQNLTTPATAFGQAVIVDTNGVRPVAAADSADPGLALGITVRPFPGTDNTVANPGVVGFGAGTPMAKGIIDVLKRGYISVVVNAGTPTKQGGVFVYYGVNSAPHVQAGFEGAAGANLWQVAGAYFTGAKDAQGNCEVAFKI